MAININCQYCDKRLICNHPARSKFLWIFKRQCVIATGQLALGQRCDLQKVFPEPEILNIQTKRKRLKGIHQKICMNCYFYNENWEKEWDQKEHSWCNKKNFDILNDKESEKLGYCKYFTKRKRIKPERMDHLVKGAEFGKSKEVPKEINKEGEKDAKSRRRSIKS